MHSGSLLSSARSSSITHAARAVIRRLCFIAGASAVLAGCGSEGDPGVPVNLGEPDVLEGVEPTAGFEFQSVSYTVPGVGMERTLRLNVWYATDDSEGTATRFNALSSDANSLHQASVRVPRDRAPLMVYSHGNLDWGGGVHAIARQFVRNGWIVVAPDHAGNTPFDAITPRPFTMDILRAYDVRAAIDFVATLADGHPLAGHVDTSRVLVSGFSSGGQTAWIVGGATLDMDAIAAECAPDCVEAELDAYRLYEPDPRVVGVVSYDGGVGPNRVADAGFAQLIAPVLFMTTSDHASDRELFERASGADITWTQLEGGCHHSFTGHLGCSTLPLSTSLPVTATYSIAFGTRTVLQSADSAVLAILDGTTVVDPVVTYARTPR